MLKSVATAWKSTPPACTAFAEKARWNSQMTTVWIKEKQQPLKLTAPWLRKSSVHCDLFQHQLKSWGIEPLKMPMNIEKHQELKERQLYLNYYLEITTSSTVSVQIFMTLWSLCRGDGNNHGTHLPQSIQHMTTRKPDSHMRLLHYVSFGHITYKHPECNANNVNFRSNTCIYSKKSSDVQTNYSVSAKMIRVIVCWF